MSGSDDYNYTEVTYYNPMDRINKSAYITAQAILVALSVLLNLAVIACVVYLLVKRRQVVRRSPRYIPMLACSVTQLGMAVWHSVVYLHVARLRQPNESSPFTCAGNLAVEVSVFMMISLVMLLVAAVVMSEALRLQTFVALTWTLQKVVAVVLVGLAVLYVFVVIVPIFMLTQLEDPSKPCFEGTDDIHYAFEEDRQLIFPMFYFLVPAFILLACIVLIVASRFCTSASSTNWSGGYAVSFSVPASATAVPDHNDGENGPVDPNITFNHPDHSQPSGSSSGTTPPTAASTGVVNPNSGFSALTPHHRPPSAQFVPIPPSQPQPSEREFPFNVILAAVACIVLEFTWFYRAVKESSDDELWLAGIMLSMMIHVFVPLFWLLDSEIRALWWCCRGRNSGSGLLYTDDTVLVPSQQQ